MLDDDVKKCELVWVLCRGLFDCLLFRFRPPPLGNIIHGCNEERKQASKQESKKESMEPAGGGCWAGIFFTLSSESFYSSSCSFLFCLLALSL